METILGYTKSVVFHNETNSYSVVKIRIDQKKEEIVTITGYFKPLNKEILGRYYGEFVVHPRFGKQFNLDHLEEVLPDDDIGIIRFLSSSLFPGVGVSSAKKIVDSLGKDCLDKIKEDSSILDSVNISEKQKASIINGLKNTNNLAEAMTLFLGRGIEMKTLIKMDAIYGKDMVDIVKANPYNLIKDIDGVNFKMADKLAFSLGISENDERRIEALINYCAMQICYKSQDSYTNEHEIFKLASSYIETLDYDGFSVALSKCVEMHDLVLENNNLFPYKLYQAENGIASLLTRYIHESVSNSDEQLNYEINEAEKSLGIKYSDDQISAIKKALNSNLLIISGGPGTGKTTVVNAIIRIYKNLYKDKTIQICAPTGRAAKRISELSNHEATTIHRYLGWDLETNTFEHDEFNTLSGDFLIIDEFSMVDAQLFYHLLLATKSFNKILLIGDDKQLPPLAPGDVLRDLLALDKINHALLDKIHRQSDTSGIIPLCYDVRNGIVNETNLAKDDVSFVSCLNYEVKDYLIKIIEEAFNNGLSEKDIQVLAPMYDGVAGINNLNESLREYFNPKAVNKDEIIINRIVFRVGDKILQLKNQPSDDVYNGDIGILEEIIANENEDKSKVIINFDGNLVVYNEQTINNFTHAYCVSVHKSQGSEYKLVIMVVLNEARFMLRRKLLYTGISRAKENLIILGDLSTFKSGVTKKEISNRKTSLQERINKIFNMNNSSFKG